MTSESTIGTNVTDVGKILTEAIELVSVIGKSKAEEEEEEADLADAAADIAAAVDEATGEQSNNFAQA